MCMIMFIKCRNQRLKQQKSDENTRHRFILAHLSCLRRFLFPSYVLRHQFAPDNVDAVPYFAILNG